MKQYLDKDQTAKLLELGFPRPRFNFPVEDNKHPDYVDEDGILWSLVESYSVGELIEFLDKNLLTIGVTTILNLPIKHFVQFTKDCTKVGYTQIQGELIDKLFEACVTLKEEGIIWPTKK